MRGVFVSSRLDLQAHFGAAFREAAPEASMSSHGAVDDPDTIDFAVAWHPPADGFRPYTGLRLIASIASGTDNIFACPSLSRGVPVIRMRDPDQARTASHFVLWHVLYWQRRFDLFLAQQRDQRWVRHDQTPASDTQVGVLGLGHIGGQIARDLASNGFRTRGYRRQLVAGAAISDIEVFTGPDGLDQVLRSSDILICALPLTPETRGILNARTFARMKRGSFLIHVGRGEHLIEADLLAALDSGQIAGASIDVFAVEPLPQGHPFWTHPGVVVTPHNAADVRAEVVAQTVQSEMRRVLAGQVPLNVVERARGY